MAADLRAGRRAVLQGERFHAFPSLPRGPEAFLKEVGELTGVAALLLLVLLSTEGFDLPHRFQVEGLELAVVGAEVTPDKRNFVVHVDVREQLGREARVHWQDWFAAIAVDGTRMRPPTDVGVDDGSGLRRCFGSQPIKPGQRLRLMIYWPIYAHELPIRLWCKGGALSREGFR